MLCCKAIKKEDLVQVLYLNQNRDASTMLRMVLLVLKLVLICMKFEGVSCCDPHGQNCKF